MGEERQCIHHMKELNEIKQATAINTLKISEHDKLLCEHKVCIDKLTEHIIHHIGVMSRIEANIVSIDKAHSSFIPKLSIILTFVTMLTGGLAYFFNAILHK